ncbi:TPA: type VI secretion system baseplate subunit TssK [Enterobacter ludwigii]
MTKAEKVVWTEGMFLRPHHFQRTESYLLNHVREWGALQRSYLWGFLDVELDEAMLRQGCIALSYCSGLLPDGTFFQVRNGRNGPVPLKIPDNLTNEKVVLALPVRRGEREEVIFSEEPASLARFIAFEQEVEDDNAMSVGDATVQFGRMRLTLMLEKDVTAEWTAIRAIIAAMLQSFNPEQLEEQAKQNGMTSRLALPGSRKAALWDYFVRSYGETAGEIEDDFHTLFGEAFLHAYDMEVNQYKDSQSGSEEK